MSLQRCSAASTHDLEGARLQLVVTASACEFMTGVALGVVVESARSPIGEESCDGGRES